MTTTHQRTDHEIRRAVQDELAWTPDVHDAGIGVAVLDGTVTVSGQIEDYGTRRAVIRTVQRTAGVSTVVDDLIVHPRSYVWSVTENEIAENVQRAIAAYAGLPDTVRAEVRDHVVTLTGEVQWEFQRSDARRAVGRIRGVTYVVNDITLSARAFAADAEKRIREALIRTAALAGDTVRVRVSGTTATLTGRVHTYDERSRAQRTAWASPHIDHVVDEITVEL